MPTGYTEKIADGITFKEFAMDCARAFGACVTLRDEPGGGEAIPEELVPSTYHLEAMKNAEEELKRLQTMPDDEVEAESIAYNNKELSFSKRGRKDNTELRNKYLKMKKAVLNWKAPEAHSEMKRFMLDQINSSIKFDCGEEGDDLDKMIYATPVWKTPRVWLNDQIAKANSDIRYHKGKYVEEVNRIEKNNKWLRDLRASLEDES